jgi:hypothetical protein
MLDDIKDYMLEQPEIESHEEDCDCYDCHMDWHNPVSDWAICDACKRHLKEEAFMEKDI